MLIQLCIGGNPTVGEQSVAGASTSGRDAEDFVPGGLTLLIFFLVYLRFLLSFIPFHICCLLVRIYQFIHIFYSCQSTQVQNYSTRRSRPPISVCCTRSIETYIALWLSCLLCAMMRRLSVFLVEPKLCQRVKNHPSVAWGRTYKL